MYVCILLLFKNYFHLYEFVVYVCIHLYARVHVCVCEGQGSILHVFFIHSLLEFLRQCISVNLELTEFTRLADQ